MPYAVSIGAALHVYSGVDEASQKLYLMNAVFRLMDASTCFRCRTDS